MRELSLRPHHALCLLLFSPEGHSERYANKMQQLLAAIAQGEIKCIRMIEELDEICGYCPHNQNGRCEKADEVEDSDAKILRILGMEVNESISWIELTRRLRDDIVAENALPCVCKGCVYLSRCVGKGREQYE